jgi:membrane protease YdiL (CAAX protease family)
LTIKATGPKLLKVNTEESTPQLQQFDEQRQPVPDLGPGGTLEPTPTQTTLAAPPESWWGAWIDVLKAGLLWGGSLFILLAFSALTPIPYLLYKLISGAGSPETLFKDPWLIFFSVIAIIPAHILTFVVGWWFVTAGGKRPFLKNIGLEWPANTSPGIGLMLSILLALVLFAIAVLITLTWGGAKTEIDLLIESSRPARFVVAFAAVATAPIVEELIYRGILYTALERAAGKIIAIFAVSLLFAGVHVLQYRNNVAVILVITILSFTLTTSRAVTGKLLPAFIIHLVFNGIQSVLIVVGAFVDHELLQ